MSNTLLKIKTAGLPKFNTATYANLIPIVESQIKEIEVTEFGLTNNFLVSFAKNIRLIDNIVVQSRTEIATGELSKLDATNV